MGRLLKETPLSEIVATLEVFDKWGVTPEAFARIRRSPDIIGKEISAFMNRSYEVMHRNFLFAHTVLYNDFILPDEVAQARGLSYSEEQIRQLMDTIPSEDVVHWLRVNNFCLMPGPSNPMSLPDVCSLEPELFFSKTDGWYAGPKEKFARKDKVSCEWLAIRKGPVPNSMRKNWDEQLALLSKDERVPNAGELSWFITTYYKVHEVRLFETIYVRTSSLDSGGNRVPLGHFDKGGLVVHNWFGNDGYDSIDLASARKL